VIFFVPGYDPATRANLAGADLDPGAALFCLLHIWQRLRVWEPRSDLPGMHPEAPSPIFLL
jgi:hypothetical protein